MAGQTWTRQSVIDAIQAWHRQGRPLPALWTKNKPLAHAAYRLFGGRQNAMLAAGLEVKLLRRWSKERIIMELQTFRDLPTTQIRKQDASLADAARRRFGSLVDAVAVAGLEPSGRIWSKQRVVEVVQDRYVRRIRLPNSGRQYVALGYAARKYFGSWYNPLLAAGLSKETYDPATRKQWNKRKVLAHIHKRHRRGLCMTLAYRDDSSLYEAAKTHFGSWRKALAAANIDVPMRKQWSKQVVIEEIRELNRRGLSLSSGRNPNLAAVAARYFGSWTKALDSAGVTPKTLRRKK